VASPTDYELTAALRVARLIDEVGNQVRDVRASYRDALTQGEHADRVLMVGEQLLVRASLLMKDSQSIVPTPGLIALSRLDDSSALLILSTAFEHLEEPNEGVEIDRIAIGLAGELAVVEQCRTELMELRRHDLADGVQQVSLISDSLGYDILAPSLGPQPRRLEVKTASGQGSRSLFRFFISRNEYDVGRRLQAEWSLVACRLDGDEVVIVGWTRASSLHVYLPDDGSGRWTEALVQFPVSALIPGIPPAI
jgi:hypothetical protein